MDCCSNLAPTTFLCMTYAGDMVRTAGGEGQTTDEHHCHRDLTQACDLVQAAQPRA